MILRDQVSLRLPRLGVLSVAVMGLFALPAWSQKAPDEAAPAVQSAAIAPDGTTSLGGANAGTTSIPPDGTVTTSAYNVPAALPQEAKEVFDQWVREVEAAQLEASRKIARAREGTIRELKELQDRYTKAGQLDEAVAVRDTVRRLAGQGTAVPSPVYNVEIRPDRLSSALPDPGNLMAYRDKVGQSFYFTVTGSTEGYVWGNLIYTDDSTLSATAVHAGLLTSGQTGVIKVTILPGRDSYGGIESNGVTSASYAQWPGSYTVEASNSYHPRATRWRARRLHPGGPGAGGPSDGDSGSGFPGGPGVAVPGGPVPQPGNSGGDPGIAIPSDPAPQPALPPPTLPGPGGSGGTLPAPGVSEPRTDVSNLGPSDLAGAALNVQDHRGQVGQSIETDLVGSTQGQVWGTGIYSDDSSPAVAAVHAGVLRDGESGRVKITILPGQDKYEGSDRNGVSSQPWANWEGSFRIERAQPSDKSAGNPVHLSAPNER